MLLCMHVTSVLFLVWLAIILPWLWISIGVTHSYSSRPFLCTLAITKCTLKHTTAEYTLFKALHKLIRTTTVKMKSLVQVHWLQVDSICVSLLPLTVMIEKVTLLPLTVMLEKLFWNQTNRSMVKPNTPRSDSVATATKTHSCQVKRFTLRI